MDQKQDDPKMAARSRRAREHQHRIDVRAKKKNTPRRRDKQRNSRRVFSQDRRANRYSEMGRDMEKRVEGIGQGMAEAGVLVSFCYHEPNSPEDQEGRDFTVVKQVGGMPIERSFGITISHNRGALASQMRHPDVPQFFFPWNIKQLNYL